MQRDELLPLLMKGQVSITQLNSDLSLLAMITTERIQVDDIYKQMLNIYFS